jgi:hypothetical protein
LNMNMEDVILLAWAGPVKMFRICCVACALTSLKLLTGKQNVSKIRGVFVVVGFLTSTIWGIYSMNYAVQRGNSTVE